jgi:hypothetical protein
LIEVPDPEILSTDRYDRPRYQDLKKDFDPEKPIPELDKEIVFDLHIYGLSGQRLKTIPIEGSYAAAFLTGAWLSDRWILLTVESRGVARYDLFVDTETGRKVLCRSGGNVLVTPDGRSVIFARDNLLYYDFRSIYPIAGVPLLNLGSRESWEQYRQRHFVEGLPTQRERLQDEYTDIRRYALSLDGNEIVALDMRPFGPQLRRERKIDLARIPSGAPPPAVVLIDLEKLRADHSMSEYARSVDLPKDPDLRLVKLQSGEPAVVGKDGRTVVWKGKSPAASKPR